MGGRRPFGFEQDMTIRASEATAVRQAYADVLVGVSLGQVARDWNAAGPLTPLKTRKGEPSRWRPATVRPVLMNPRFAGLRGYGPKLDSRDQLAADEQFAAQIPRPIQLADSHSSMSRRLSASVGVPRTPSVIVP
jgi:hypothetical protein